MNAASIATLAVVAAAFIAAIVSVCRKRRNGRCKSCTSTYCPFNKKSN